jgi:hypothetical protein
LTEFQDAPVGPRTQMIVRARHDPGALFLRIW